ncbi:MAG: hypothetical protein PHP52_13540 [Bacteroidales bacterium]|nr:hypothetical protein [Bacteroidales bacterium]MDD4216929.1 hypothetical protein [Bacteroidales bacterium]MDY0141230.1 hypothetical protein [Bacteroidales bacterium]
MANTASKRKTTKKAIKPKQKTELELLFELMLKKASLKPEDIYSTSMKLWIMEHANELLTPEEKKKFKHLFA